MYQTKKVFIASKAFCGRVGSRLSGTVAVKRTCLTKKEESKTVLDEGENSKLGFAVFSSTYLIFMSQLSSYAISARIPFYRNACNEESLDLQD